MGLYFQGLTMGLAYVAPIGMQNLFVINSALTRTRRNALITAVIVIFFDIVLSLACFFGIGALMQAHPWLQTAWPGRRRRGAHRSGTAATEEEVDFRERRWGRCCCCCDCFDGESGRWC